MYGITICTITMSKKYSNAGKGDKLRRGISQDEWEKKYDKIFRRKDGKNKKRPVPKT